MKQGGSPNTKVFVCFVKILLTSIHHLSQNGSSQQCRTHATQFYHSSNNSNFIICLIIIAQYTSMLEPVTQMLQAVEIDIIKVQKHISNLIHQFTNHRDSCDNTFETLYSEIQEQSVELDIDVSRPRLCKKQTKRNNYTVESTEDYYRVSICIPYLDSINNSLNVRFLSSTEILSLLNDVNPKRITDMSVKNCARHIIFVPKWSVECPLEHTIQNSILMFPT